MRFAPAKVRQVPDNPEVLAVLKKLPKHIAGPFATLKDNLGLTWCELLEELDIPLVTIHDLRRTYITRLIRAGVALPTVQKLSGHANIKVIIDYYNRVADDDLRAAVEKLRHASAG